MTDRRLIILSLEGLATSALSCYGASWIKTPAIDAIASTGCIWDRWVATSDDPLTLLRETTADSPQGWANRWRDGASVELITDVASATDDFERSCFDRVDHVPSRQPLASEQPAADLVDTQFGQLVAAAIHRDSQDPPWGVLWLHSGFLARRWDAPRGLFLIDDVDEQQEPSEEAPWDQPEPEDVDRLPPVFETIVPPNVRLDENSHPDLVTSWMRTYGCQIRLLDLLIEVLLGSLRVEDPYVILLGTSGFRLGQGGRIGHRQGPLRSPDIRLPLVVSDIGPLRVPQLTASSTLPQVLCDLYASGGESMMPADRWSRSEPESEIRTRSSRAGLAVTTPDWFFVQDSDASTHLFLKPDDVEDFNDVGRIREDIVRQWIP